MNHQILGINNSIVGNVEYIIDRNLTWKQAVKKFNIKDGNLQRVYIRYIIKKYDYMTALNLVKNEMV